MVDTFDCARAQIYHNTAKLSPAQIKAKTGCTHIINGYLFNGRFVPVGWTVIDGKIISRDKYQDWGVSIGSDGKPQMLTDRGGSFLSGVPILKAGSKLYRGLTADVARPAARTAVGWLANGKVCLWWTEAAVLTSLGGLLGVLCGIGLAEMLSHVMGTAVAISAPACIVAVAFSMVIGIVFGLVPAVKASRLNPIEALRRE